MPTGYTITGTGPNPEGFCLCGCGERAPIARAGRLSRGDVKGTPMRFIPGHQRRSSPIEYIEQDCGYDTPCWVWQKSKSVYGYGRKCSGDGKYMPAHRWFYEQHVGLIPEGLHLDHLCRNRACVNPEHLEPVTCAENIRRGSSAKLCVDQVRIIRQLLTLGFRRQDVAQAFDVCYLTICSIATNKSWQGV